MVQKILLIVSDNKKEHKIFKKFSLNFQTPGKTNVDIYIGTIRY